MAMKGKTWRRERNQKKRARKRDFSVLSQPAKKEEFENNLKRRMGDDWSWSATQNALKQTIEDVCPLKTPARQPWIDGECWRLIEERAEEKPTQ